MATFRETLNQLNKAADTFEHELNNAGYGGYRFSPEDSPYNLSFLNAEGLGARGDLIAAAERILRLAKGPQGCLASCADMGIELGIIQALTQLKVPDKIPLSGSISYEELAISVNVSMELLRRMIRLAVLADFLVEDAEGRIRHSAMSAVFIRDPAAGDTARFMFDVDMRAYSFFADSIRLDPTGQHIRDSPIAVAFQNAPNDKGDRPTIWEIMERDPVQSQRFDATMQALGTFPSHLLTHVLNAFDWSKIRNLVDIGGSLGHTSLMIAEHFPAIQILVQDLPHVVERGRSSLPAAPHASRITFQAHDLFHQQKTSADAYMLRQILHDWPDEDAERIVRNIIPVMVPGTRLIVMDIIVPPPGAISPYMEKYLRTYDVSMFSMFSGKERTLREFRDIVERCSDKLHFEGMTCPPGSAISLLSWVYNAEAKNGQKTMEHD